MAASFGDAHPCCHGGVYDVISATPSVTRCHVARRGLLGGKRLACKSLRDHCVDLGGVEGALRMIDQRLRKGEHDRLVLLDDRQSFLIAVLNEGRAARIAAADNPRDVVFAL